MQALNERLAREIEQRKETEAALRNETERFSRLTDTLPHGIQEIDLDGTIIFANPAYHRMNGYEDGELLGKPIWHLVEPQSRAQELKEYFQTIITQHPDKSRCSRLRQ